MDLVLKKIKTNLNVLKIRLFVAEVVTILINIFNLDYNGSVLIVRRNSFSHHKRIFRKILIYFIMLNISFTITSSCGASFMQIYYPKEFNLLDTTGNISKAQEIVALLMIFSGFKYLATLYLLKNWLNNRNGKLLKCLLNELISIWQKLCKHTDFEFNKIPPQCSLIFHMHLFLTIQNILKNTFRVSLFDDTFSGIMDFGIDVYYASICFMYQMMLLVLWNLHYYVNKYFEIRIECTAIKKKDLLTFLNLLQCLKNAQCNFANHFSWLPWIERVKVFFLIAESSCFWNYLHQRGLLAEIKLNWLYRNAFLCWLDLYLLTFLLEELCKLNRHSQYLLCKKIIRESTQEYLTAAFLLDHHIKPYTTYLHLNAQQICRWTLLTPLAFGYIMSYINPIDLRYLQMLGQ